MSRYDEFAQSQMKDSLTFDEEKGKYRVALPWKYGREETAKIFSETDFLSTARDRQRKLKAKLLRNPAQREFAFATMNDTLEKNHAQVLSDVGSDPTNPVCYLPIHMAPQPHKSKPWRLCQDAAAITSGRCLNQFLLTGPDYLNSLVGVLLKFRRGRIALLADIEKFFYQILIDPKDAPAMRYLWWEGPEMEKEIVLETRVHIFGAGSSPTVANYC